MVGFHHILAEKKITLLLREASTENAREINRLIENTSPKVDQVSVVRIVHKKMEEQLDNDLMNIVQILKDCFDSITQIDSGTAESITQKFQHVFKYNLLRNYEMSLKSKVDQTRMPKDTKGSMIRGFGMTAQMYFKNYFERLSIAIEEHNISLIKNEEDKSANQIIIEGNAQGSNFIIGSNNKIKSKVDWINNLNSVDDSLRNTLEKAVEVIGTLGLQQVDKQDILDDLQKLGKELDKDEPDPTRIKRFYERIKEIAPTVGGILSAVANIATLLG